MEFIIALLGVILLTAAILGWVTVHGIEKERDELLEIIRNLKESHERSLNAQRAVVKGQISEHLWPLRVDCIYPSSDMRFMGQPVDYIVFKGYTDGSVDEVCFIEVKTGKSQLSPIQRSIRDAITAGRVSWQTLRLKDADEDH